MNGTKTRQIEYHTLNKKIWRTEEEEYQPFIEIKDLLFFIKKKNRIARMHQLKNNKYCMLEGYSASEDGTIITGFFKSAIRDFRPNLINLTNATERENPKLIQEGDIEKTHFCIKIIKTKEDIDVFIILEKNGNGVSINQILDYLKQYHKEWLKSKEEKRSYSLCSAIVGREDFSEMLKKMQRAKIAEIYFDKTLVGHEALNFSDKTIDAQRTVVLTVKAEKNASIKETGFDFLQALQMKGSKISKIRIFGVDEEKHDVMIDTQFMGKKTSIEAELNPSTGEVVTTNIFTELKELAEELA